MEPPAGFGTLRELREVGATLTLDPTLNLRMSVALSHGHCQALEGGLTMYIIRHVRLTRSILAFAHCGTGKAWEPIPIPAHLVMPAFVELQVGCHIKR